MSASVHPTAIIGDQVELEDDVDVGAYSVVAGNVRIGAGSRLHHHVSIGGDTSIGANNEFFPFSSIGHISQDLRAVDAEGARLEIGEGNIFRESVTANLGCHDQRLTRIGDRNLFMACSHIAHDCLIANDVVLANNVLLAGHVHIGDHAVIGGACAVHQFVRIGRSCMIGGCSRVTHDIPPFFLANGNPIYASSINRVGLRRLGYSKDRIARILDLFRLFCSTSCSRLQTLSALSAEAGKGEDERLFFDFVNASAKRPLVRRRISSAD